MQHILAYASISTHIYPAGSNSSFAQADPPTCCRNSAREQASQQAKGQASQHAGQQASKLPVPTQASQPVWR